MRNLCISSALVAATLTGAANAQSLIPVNSDISVSTTWTANNVYDLRRQIYVLPGATLTIEAGTVVASTTTANGSGSLAVTNGARIIVQGTETAPVVMTSSSDRATWTGGDPKTGTWREAANEWGNLTICGDAYIAEDATVGNTPFPSASNVATMEGLTAAFPGDPRVLYGGGNDDYDAGSINYLSIRYGGRVIGLNNELNGLSLGGIGRETDISHVEIMNNVDDGIEIWGGTVNINYFSIWNIGDDSLDIDQGYRGKCQFGLIVQGYSLDAGQGSGVGDNAIETDGAEDSDWQPRTRTQMRNLTVIGQPLDGDGLTAWRDNAGVQYKHCVFMDGGETVVRFDNVDGDGGSGYGHNGTLSWAQHWTTPASTLPIVNAPANPGAFYASQDPAGNICEFTDSVFFNNNAGNAYTEFNARGQNGAAFNNVVEPANSPIAAIQRAPTVVRGGRAMQRVTSIDPSAANDALTVAAVCPKDSFFSSVAFRGAFGRNSNWLAGWSAADAFGFLQNSAWQNVGGGCEGVRGVPVQGALGTAVAGNPVTLSLDNGAPNAPVALAISVSRVNLPLFGCELIPDVLGAGFTLSLATDANGSYSLTFPWPAGITPGATIYVQSLVGDPAANSGLLSFSNGVVTITQ